MYIALMTALEISKLHDIWVVDSGASDHMTNKLTKIHDFTPFLISSFVSIANGLAQQSAEKGFFKGKRSNLKCAYCNSMGHSKDRCWGLHPELKPKDLQNRHNSHKQIFKPKANVAAHISEPIYTSPMSLLNEFASFLQEKRNQGSEGAAADESSAFLNNFEIGRAHV